jgi:hypothetical protein
MHERAGASSKTPNRYKGLNRLVQSKRIREVPESSISEEVQQFLVKQVRSIERLEILLLLSSSPERSWAAGEVYRAVLTNEHSVEETLERFCQEGLAGKSEAAPATYQYAPASEAVKGLVAQLARLYKERPVSVIDVIYRRSVSDVEEFARAFRLRKDT